MTVPELLTLIAAGAAALVTIVNAIANGWGRKDARAAADAASVKLDTADKKLDQIHVLTNSNLAAVQDKLKEALGRIDRLEQLLANAGRTVPKDRRRKS